MNANADWIPVTYGLPTPGRMVLVCYAENGKRFRACAEYAPEHTMRMGENEGDLNCLYDEVEDAYYCPPGWYCQNAVDETEWFLDGVTHWIDVPLPEVTTCI